MHAVAARRRPQRDDISALGDFGPDAVRPAGYGVSEVFVRPTMPFRRGIHIGTCLRRRMPDGVTIRVSIGRPISGSAGAFQSSQQRQQVGFPLGGLSIIFRALKMREERLVPTDPPRLSAIIPSKIIKSARRTLGTQTLARPRDSEPLTSAEGSFAHSSLPGNKAPLPPPTACAIKAARARSSAG